MDPVLETLVWIVAGALVLGLVAFIFLRWLAVRIATRVAAEAEARVAAALARGMRRAGGPKTPVVTDELLQRRYLAQIDRIAKIMDGLIPLPVIGGIGLDAVIGLVPGIGDAVGLAAASLLIVRAAQLGAPPELLGRLVSMQCLDLIFGAVPVLGDLVDAGYRANQRSADLVHEWFNARSSEAGSSDPAI
jgi:hypothetical protein